MDVMPDKEDLNSSMTDKRMLQINLFLCQGQTERAAKELQNMLLMALNKLQMLLCKTIDAELADGRMQAAKEIADKTSRMAVLFGIRLLRKMLAAMRTPWVMSNSPLFCRIAGKTSGPKQMLPAILSEMEKETPGCR